MVQGSVTSQQIWDQFSGSWSYLSGAEAADFRRQLSWEESCARPVIVKEVECAYPQTPSVIRISDTAYHYLQIHNRFDPIYFLFALWCRYFD